MEETKKCGQCKGEYTLDQFPTVKGRKIPTCRTCKREYQKKWIRAKREKIKKEQGNEI